jgi:site-specific recombinase XerD
MDRWKVFDPGVWNMVHAYLAPSTLNHYRSIFSLFQNYLSDVGQTVQNAEVEDVLAFIQDYADDCKAELTICSVYAAVLFHFCMEGRHAFLTANPIVQMFLKGAQRLAPPSLKKQVVWDPEIPLSFISARSRPTRFREAGQEALLLLLLSTGIRVDCASKMSNSFQVNSNFCEIPYLLPRKTGVSDQQVIRLFTENPRLCLVKAVEHFVSLSDPVRKSQEPFLFISSSGCWAHIDTLRHWVSDLLSEAGVQASAGSCRSASASAAVVRDVNINIVMKSAGWARESTLRWFYQRQVLKVNEGYNLVRSSCVV